MEEPLGPYFSHDTDGVHFQVQVDGLWVRAHITRGDLVRVYGPCAGADECMLAFRLHEQFLRDAAIRRATAFGPETILLAYGELLCLVAENDRGAASATSLRTKVTGAG